MTKPDDVPRKIGKALETLLATRGVGGKFDASEMVKEYKSQNPGDEKIKKEDGGHKLEGYLNGRLYGYMGANNKNNGKYGPKIKHLGPLRYQFV